jgi:Lar family restriction alleviation protein
MTDSTDNALKPCPFCGAADSSEVFVERRDDGRTWEVTCDATDCIAAGPVRPTKREAVAAWNRRADLAPADVMADARVDALVALLTEARGDLEHYVTHEYPKDQHPYYARQWHRDMELCRRIDAALASITDTGGRGMDDLDMGKTARLYHREYIDEITALRARLEAVEKERDEAQLGHRHEKNLRLEMIAHVERAEAEVARLTAAAETARRDALEGAAKYMYQHWDDDDAQMHRDAIRAMKEPKP